MQLSFNTPLRQWLSAARHGIPRRDPRRGIRGPAGTEVEGEQMLNRKIRHLAVTGITIVSATALTALGATSASAAPTVAATPGHVTAPKPVIQIKPCVFQTFGPSNTYQECVADLQVLLNDLWYIHYRGPEGRLGPNQLLATDGYYGPDTASDVASVNANWLGSVGGDEATPDTWSVVCGADKISGFRGVYWHNASCPNMVGE
jgi:hypothetical protein